MGAFFPGDCSWTNTLQTHNVLSLSRQADLELWYPKEAKMCLCPSVLVLSRVELISFLVAGIMLCFEFVRRAVLITAPTEAGRVNKRLGGV